MPPLKEDRKKAEKLRSVRKPKSHLNMPANLKISIPLQGTEQEGVHIPIVKGRRPPQFTRHLDIKTKINLANSVARQQLVKEEPPVFQVDNVVIIQTPKPRGRKRKVKVVSDFFEKSVVENNAAEINVTATDTKLPEKISPEKKPAAIKKPAPTRKILTRKRLADSKAQEDAKRSKVEEKTDTETRDLIIKLEDNSIDGPVESECDPFVEPLPTVAVQPTPTVVVQPTPVVVEVTPGVVEPTSEVVQPQLKITKSSVKRLQRTAKKPLPMRQPGRKRGLKGKHQNVQASVETPSTVDLLKNNITEPVVETNQNQHNAPELVESRKHSVSSSSNLLKNKVTETIVRTKQDQKNAQGLVKSQKKSVGSSPILLRNKVTEAVVNTKQNQQNAPELMESRNNSLSSSPNLLKNKLTETVVRTKQNQQNAQRLAKSRMNSVSNSPNLLKNTLTETVVNAKQNQQNAPRSVVSRNNSVDSSPNLLRNKVTEAIVKTTQNQLNEPGLVDSRKNSVGSSSNKSWTRDISSSSNTTCIGSVCSNDFVRINKKLPVLKLTNIDSELKKRLNEAQEIAASVAADETDEDLSDSSDSDSSDSEKKISEQFNDSLGANSLHLSASSSSQFTQSRRKDNSSDYGKAANKLSLTMEKLDLEIIKWMTSENENVNANLVKFRDKMFDILDREFGVITHCRHLKEMLNPPKAGGSIEETSTLKQVQEDAINDIENVEENDPVVENTSVVDKAPVKNFPVVEYAPIVENTNTPVENHTTRLVNDLGPRRRLSRNLSNISEGNISNASTKASKDVSSDDETAAGTSYPYYDHHDDDDTLSLFAESISGFESTRINTSNTSVVVPKPHQVEEYIPKPVNEDYVPNTEKQTYCPTKIREDAELIASKIINVCEKQNADSTSIYKQSNSTDDAESYQDFTENIDLDTRLGPPDMIKKPRLMDSYYDALPKSRSVVFNTLCFYNLMNCCRKVFYGQCRFLHLIPTSDQIKEKLSHLDERMLIQEYMLLRNWSELRRRYGMCYVEECAKRGLTRILIEMAYDFIVKARNECEEDTRRRVNAIEATLLHLNTVDLSICEDLLKLTIHSDQVNRTLLCDVFMATMSITQNFSRFKIAFLNLTYFMVDNDRTFNKDVVEHILERVCILPFEEPVARALIQMMRLTKSDIFNNSMIGHFEKQISVNKDVFEDYTLLKNQWAFSSMLASSVVSASPPARPDAPEPQPPAASPDTTNLDNMSKAAEEPSKPVITRTIGMNPAIIFNRAALISGDSRARVSPGLSKSLANPGPSKSYVNNTESDTSDDSVKQNIRKWRNRSIFPHIRPPRMAGLAFMHGTPTRGTPTRGTMRPPMWPHMRPPQRLPFNQRQVTFKSPSNYISRQPGPQY